MSDTDSVLDYEADLERMKMEAGMAQQGLPVPLPEGEEPPVGAAETNEGSQGGESTDDDSESKGSTEEVSSGTDSTEDGQGSEEGSEDAAGSGKKLSDNSQTEDDEAEGKEPEAKGKTRQEKKADALERNWQNADRRHKEADERGRQLDAREAQLSQQEQRIKAMEKPAPQDPLPRYSPEEIGSSIQDFLDDGDADTVKQLVDGLVAKANANKAFVPEGPGSEPFEQAREQVRQRVIQANPDLNDPQSGLYQTATALLNGDWGAVLGSHPAGIAAAVEVAKMQVEAASVPELKDQIEQLKTEISQLKRSTQLGKTGATKKGQSTPRKGTLENVDEDVASLYEEAKRGQARQFVVAR